MAHLRRTGVGGHREQVPRLRASATLRGAGLACSRGRTPTGLCGKALLTDPELLLLDEPCAGLDMGGRERLLAHLRALAAGPGSAPIVMVTHHVEGIPEGFTHVLLLHAGSVLSAGPIASSLTARALSECFGLPLELHHDAGRAGGPASPPARLEDVHRRFEQRTGAYSPGRTPPRASCCTDHARAAYGEMANVGEKTVTRFQLVNQRFEQPWSDLDHTTAFLADEVLVRPPAGQVPLGRPVTQVHVIGDVKFFEAFKGAVDGALADVGVLSGNHCDDLLGTAMAFGAYQGGDDTTQGDGGTPSSLPHRPDSRVDSGLTRHYRLRATPFTEVIGYHEAGSNSSQSSADGEKGFEPLVDIRDRIQVATKRLCEPTLDLFPSRAFVQDAPQVQ